MPSGRFKPKKMSAELNITSMMDMFTIILVFLLKSFSADGSILTNADGLVLPNSTSKKKPAEVNLQLAVTQAREGLPSVIILDNQVVVETQVARNIPQSQPDQIIVQLEERLRETRKREEEMVAKGALNKFEGAIIVQLDKNIEFDVLYKIMATCGKVGYNHMNFAVMERDE